MSDSAFLIPRRTRIDALEVDCVVTATHVGEVEVTDHPVEEGADVSDHVRPLPERLTIDGIISNTPLNKTVKRTLNVQGVVLETEGESALAGEPGYAESAYETLRSIKDAGKLISVATPLRVYDDMVLQSLTVPKNNTTGEALRFTAQLKRVRIVASKLTSATVTKDAKGKGKASGGKKVPKQAPDDLKKKSWAYELSEKLGILEAMGIKKP